MARQLRDFGVSAQLFSNFWAGKKEVIGAAGSAGEGLLFAEMSTDLTQLKADLTVIAHSRGGL